MHIEFNSRDIGACLASNYRLGLDTKGTRLKTQHQHWFTGNPSVELRSNGSGIIISRQALDEGQFGLLERWIFGMVSTFWTVSAILAYQTLVGSLSLLLSLFFSCLEKDQSISLQKTAAADPAAAAAAAADHYFVQEETPSLMMTTAKHQQEQHECAQINGLMEREHNKRVSQHTVMATVTSSRSALYIVITFLLPSATATNRPLSIAFL
jgi:hypothetical protein